MRGAKRHAFCGEVVRDLGRARKTAVRGACHRVGVEACLLQHFGKHGERDAQCFVRVEYRLFVLLHVLVVGEGKPFHDGEHSGEVAEDPSRFAAEQFAHVGIFLLRHDGRACGKLIGELDKRELSARPIHELLVDAREVEHDERRRRKVFDDEITVGYAVERVFRNAVEAQKLCGERAVDGERRSDRRAVAERHYVDALAAVFQPLGVAQEHIGISGEVVPERRRLRLLHVRIRRHNVLRVLFRKIGEHADELAKL